MKPKLYMITIFIYLIKSRLNTASHWAYNNYQKTKSKNSYAFEIYNFSSKIISIIKFF